jgi:hypothetical protein
MIRRIVALVLALIALAAPAILLAALLLLRLARRRWLALLTAVIAAMSGAYAIWLSQQALKAFQDYSLVPWSFPPGYFQTHSEHVDNMARGYLTWSVIAAALLLVVLAITLALLSGMIPPSGTSERVTSDERRFSIRRALTLGAFACVLLAPAAALGMVFELERAAPCQQRYDPACSSLDAMVAAGTVIRGAGIVLVGLAITLGCALLLRFRHFRLQWPIALGASLIAFTSGLWLIWFSQRILDEYLPAPWNAETYPPGAFDGRVEVMAHLAQSYILWGVGAVALAAVIASIALITVRGRKDGGPETSVPIAAA